MGSISYARHRSRRPSFGTPCGYLHPELYRKRLAVLWDALSADQYAAAERRAKLLGLQVRSLKLENPPCDFDAAFRTVAETDPQMLLVLSSPFFGPQSGRITELAIQHRPPSMFIFKPYTVSGGLMSFGTDSVALYRQGASFVARILQGVKPTELPVKLPTSSSSPSIPRPPRRSASSCRPRSLLRANDVIQ